MYKLFIAPIVKRMKPGNASRFALRYFRFIGRIPGGRVINRIIHGNRPTGLQKEVFGLDFYNPLGLGAGLDINGELYNDLNDLGFSFSEIGPLDGKNIEKALKNIQNDPQNDILAACISADAYRTFTLAYDFCDFFVIELSEKTGLDTVDLLLDARLTNDAYKPIVLKVQEKISAEELDRIIDYCMMNRVDGIQVRNLEQIGAVVSATKGRLPIIANCRNQTPETALEMLEAGASLIEVRSGLVYKGPSLVTDILKYIESNYVKDNGRN